MKKRLILAAKALGVLLVGIGLLYAALVISGAIALSSARSALEKAGRPMSPSQIIPPEIPDQENAAPLYEAAIKILEATPLHEGGKEKISNAFSKLDLASLGGENEKSSELRALLKSEALKSVMDLVEKGNAREKCRYSLKYQDGPNTLLPHIYSYRKIVYVFCAKAILDDFDGKSGQAWGEIASALKFANSLHDEPFLISQLVRAASFQIAASAASILFERSIPDEKRTAELLEALKPFEDMQPLLTCLDAERLLLGNFIFTAKASLSAAAGDDFGKRMMAISILPTCRLDYSFYLNAMNNLSSSAELPYSQCKKDWEATCKVPWYYPLSGMALPAMAGIKEHYLAMPAKVKVFRAGIALIQYRQAKGTFPNTLAELGQPGLIDPFTGESLIYRKDGDGFVVYSVDADMKDDNGRVKPDTKRALDIGWRFSQAKP